LTSSNLWTAISGLVGVLLGGWISSRIQNNTEKRKKKEARYDSFVRAWITTSMANDFAMGISSTFQPLKNDPARHLNIPLLSIYVPSPKVECFFFSLSFVPMKHKALMERLEAFRTRFHTLMSSFRKRSELYEQFLRIAAEKIPSQASSNRIRGYATPETIIPIVGKILYYQLQTHTDAIYLDMEYIITELPKIQKDMLVLQAELFPEAKQA
jgi:hypothetical protein